MLEILTRLDLCYDGDAKDAAKHLEQIKMLSEEASVILQKWEQTPKGTRGCGDLFVCKQKIYKNVASVAFYLKIVVDTLEANNGNEDMPSDDTPYHVLTACVAALEKTRPNVSVPSLLKCVERFAQSAEMKKNKWDARRHYAAKNYGAALGHVERMNKISQQHTKWFDTQTQSIHPWTEELRAICKSLRIPEATEPVPHKDVNLHD